MAVDLSDLVDPLKREVNAPGINQLPNATDADYVGQLQDGFWDTVLDGMITGYTESDAIVTPTESGGTDLSRELQQLIVFYAGYKIVRNQLRDIKTTFRAKAGPVEYETQQAATVLTALLNELKDKRNIVLTRLSDLGQVPSYYIDAVISRDIRTGFEDIYWINY